MVHDLKQKKGPKKSYPASKIRLPGDFHWKLLTKLISDFRQECPTDLFEAELKQLELIIRQRDIVSYISFCKTSCALKRIEELATAHPWDVPDGNNFLLQVRFLRLLTILQKLDFPNTPYDQVGNAKKAFYDYEKLCEKTNKDPLFDSYIESEDDQRINSYDNLVTSNVLVFAREYIQRILGCVPDHESFLEMLRHGPGASYGKRGNNSILIEKYIPPLDCGLSARELATKCINDDERWSRSILDHWINDYRKIDTTSESFTPFSEWLLGKPIEHSRITFVKKDAEKRRTICIEPTMNVFLQLGLEGLMRRGLKNHGIDLNTQTKNQRLACLGSISNKLVTIDLSGASDTVALNWLKLFPEQWANIIRILRMSAGRMEDTGDIVEFQKISSMGNGFTFCVETLVFSSLFYGLLRYNGLKWKDYIDEVAFYGDDIIIPSKFYSDYSYLLHRLGFRENTSKTFSRFSFVRESCGHDYLKGYRVDRPTLKDIPKRDYELVILHNNLYIWAKNYGVTLSNSLSFISKYFREDQARGPYSPEEVVSWIFSETPTGKVYYDRDTQQYFYKIKRTEISHPLIYRSNKGSPLGLSETHEVFSPLCFLNRHHENSLRCDYKIYITKRSLIDFQNSIKSFKKKCDSDRSSPLEDHFFLKKLVSVRTTVLRLPVYSWYST